MQWIAGILAFLIGVSGWFYLFYSRAAHRLTGVENSTINSRRIMLRRAAGVVLLLLAVLFYFGFTALDRAQTPFVFMSIWAAILGLLLLVLILGLIDLRCTLRFYRQRETERKRISK